MAIKSIFLIYILFIYYTNSKIKATFTPEKFYNSKGDLVFNYYLYTPEIIKEDNMKLIVYLHGGSGKPTSKEGDLSLLINDEGFPKYLKDRNITLSSYCIIPQIPFGKNGWSDVKVEIIDFIKYNIRGLNIDEKKISLTGHSMGGKGVWDIALYSPKTFYKIAPLSGNIKTNKENLLALIDLNIWAIVGSADSIVDPKSSIEFIEKILTINENAKISVLENYGHFDVPKVYLDSNYNLIDWLLD